jgi:hypothetical protein
MAMPTRTNILDCCLIVAAIMLFLWPEADPSWLKPATDIHDAAWWADPAKQKILHGTWMNGPFAGAIAVGPLTVWLHFITFKLFGIGFFSLRLISIIPAVFAAALLRFRSSDFSAASAALLLLTSTSWFTWARLGLPELWMGFLLLASIHLLQKGGIKNSIFAAFCLLGGLLLKASFVYHLLLILPVLLLTKHRQDKYKWTFFLGAFSIGALVYYLGYLLPNEDLFSPFFTEFSANYFSLKQLLDPAGIFARIVFLTDREFFQDPSVVLLVIALLIKLGSGYRPSSRLSFTALFFLGVLLLLPSDFAGRRFIPLFPLLIVAAIEPYVEESLSNRIKVPLAVLLNWIMIGMILPAGRLFLFEDGFFHIQPFVVFLFGIQVLGLAIVWRLKKSTNTLISVYFKYSTSALSLAWIALLLRTHFLSSNWLILVASAVVLLLMLQLFSSQKFKYTAFVFIAGIGFLCNCAAFFGLSHTERDNAQVVAKILDDQQGLVAGNATTFSLTFLSSKSAMHFPMSPYWKFIKPTFIVAYSTSDQDSAATLKMVDQLILNQLEEPTKSCIPLRVWHSNQVGIFCYPRRVK